MGAGHGYSEDALSDGAAAPSGWLITGTNGENVIRAVGGTLADAYRQACEQAAAVGMLPGEP
jgi:hypothetical protein